MIFKSKKQAETSKKDEGKKIFFHFVFFLSFIILMWNLAGPYGLIKYFRMKDHFKTLYMANIQQSKMNQEVEERIRLLKTSSRAQEDAVRKELGWIKDNEVVYIFLDETR